MHLDRSCYHPDLWGELQEKHPDVYPALSIEDEQRIAEQQIRRKYAKMMEEVVKPYHQSERETWFTQLEEAELWSADNSANTPMLSAMATARGITLELMVAKVLENNALFRLAVGQILGYQQAEIDALYAT